MDYNCFLNAFHVIVFLLVKCNVTGCMLHYLGLYHNYTLYAVLDATVQPFTIEKIIFMQC